MNAIFYRIILIACSVCIVACSAPEQHHAMSHDAAGNPVISLEVQAAEGAPLLLEMHQHPVTVAAFARFVKDSAYVSTAERFGEAGVFDFERFDWSLEAGADWQHPAGLRHPEATANHPVTQVSWYDAQAYCQSLGMELPSQEIWEAVLAHESPDAASPFTWGDELKPDGDFMANYWQGLFPFRNEVEDGYLMTSPVGAFGESRSGFTDLSGNVWEWTSDWWEPSLQAPDSLHERLQVGGSFMCAPQDCLGFARGQVSHATPETSLFHTGFRCIRRVTK